VICSIFWTVAATSLQATMNTMHARGGAPAVVGAAYRASVSRTDGQRDCARQPTQYRCPSARWTVKDCVPAALPARRASLVLASLCLCVYVSVHASMAVAGASGRRRRQRGCGNGRAIDDRQDVGECHHGRPSPKVDACTVASKVARVYEPHNGTSDKICLCSPRA